MGKFKIKKQLTEIKKLSYAMETVKLPEGGIDCGEGCNPYGFYPGCAEVLKKFDTSHLNQYPHSNALYDAIIECWRDKIILERDNILLTDGSINALYIINSILDEKNTALLGISPQFTNYCTHVEMLGIEYVPYRLRKENNYKCVSDEFMGMYGKDSRFTEDSAPHRVCGFIYIDNQC